MIPRIEPGQFVTFVYKPPAKPPKGQWAYKTVPVRLPDGTTQLVNQRYRVPAPPEPPSDPSKQAFILHPNWHNKVHAIDLGRISPAEIQVLQAVMDPNVKAQADQGVWPIQGVPNYPLIRDILRRVDPVELIKNPLAFYQQLIKPFIRDKDCYRQYWPQYMFSLKVMAESHVKGPLVNPKPLFKKI
jgi:hypothetical protein